jgi:hypothetical protein
VAGENRKINPVVNNFSAQWKRIARLHHKAVQIHVRIVLFYTETCLWEGACPKCCALWACSLRFAQTTSYENAMDGGWLPSMEFCVCKTPCRKSAWMAAGCQVWSLAKPNSMFKNGTEAVFEQRNGIEAE